MNPVGAVFSLFEQNPPIPGCTVSEELKPGLVCFSLAENTDISPELYSEEKLLIGCGGQTAVMIPGREALPFSAGEITVTPSHVPVGTRAMGDTVYLELILRRSIMMNEAIRAGEVLKLGELVPYQPGKIVNMDIARQDKMKFVVMAFDAGTGLSEHAAPGEALIFALDGEGIIGYEGKEFLLRAGENFRFAKGGKHTVRAKTPFKMALLMTLD